MITNSYNGAASRARNITTEQNFGNGIKFTDVPLPEGYCKMLLNMDIADQGRTLRPRAGLRYKEALSNIALTAHAGLTVHHVADSLVTYYNTTNMEDDTVICHYALWGATEETSWLEKILGVPRKLLRLSESQVVVDFNGNYEVCTFDAPDDTHDFFLTLMPTPSQIHGISLDYASEKGPYATFDNVTYVCGWKITKSGMVTTTPNIYQLLINVKTNTFTIEPLVAEDITAVKAVNYGYNMLDETPYTFTNQAHALDSVLCDGIIPYDAQGNLAVSARLGDALTFKVAYRYPSAHVNNKTYAVQWEIQDLTTAEGTTTVLQYAKGSTPITPGSDIKISTRQTTYKEFTLICKIYDSADVNLSNTRGESNIEFGINYTPLATITLAFYYLTSDKNTTQTNLKSVNYNLVTATGLCTWMQRLVLWGVKDAPNTIWVSDINNPSYFPYPNNIEIFDSPVVTCLKYKTGLLVFCETAIYQLTFAEDGLTFNTVCVQDRLDLKADEQSAILPIQNMVMFKSGNHYYMIVPAATTSTMAGQLTLAPITKPLSDFFDNFSDNIKMLYAIREEKIYSVGEIYDPAEPGHWIDVGTPELFDWYCYVEQNWLRIVYKVAVEDTVFDLVCQYDTKSYAWTMHTYATGNERMVQFRSSATSDSVFLKPTVQNLLGHLTVYQVDLSTTYDGLFSSFRPVLEPRYVDTGYVDMGDGNTVKKRFRQIHFDVTKGSDYVSIYPTTTVDNEYRLKLYDFEDDEIVSGTELYLPDYIDVYDEASDWGLEETRYLDVPTGHVKVNISGKGRNIALHAYVQADEYFEIHGISFVYRIMTAR